ncbi:MAG: hypothetical protein ACTSVI_07510 [Promethearchaeota archaeon]
MSCSLVSARARKDMKGGGSRASTFLIYFFSWMLRSSLRSLNQGRLRGLDIFQRYSYPGAGSKAGRELTVLVISRPC